MSNEFHAGTGGDLSGQEWLDAVTASRDIAYSAMPDIVAVNEFRDVYGAALSNRLGGAGPEAELKRAAGLESKSNCRF